MVISQGKDTIAFKIKFGEKIIGATDDNAPVEYDYSAVTSIKETNRYYLLGLKYNLYLVVQKDVKGKTENVDFVQYILEKNPKLKKKKVENVMNKKKSNIICLCLFALLFVFHLIMYFV
ncbi:MAG: YcxB family protein [Clostridia bacterium]|nr:YcxB family protein [Clostridia bacterium]